MLPILAEGKCFSPLIRYLELLLESVVNLLQVFLLVSPTSGSLWNDLDQVDLLYFLS